MKGECALCHQQVTLLLDVVNGAIQATCPSCGQSFPVPTAAASAPSAAPVSPARRGPTVPVPPAPAGAAEAYLACEAQWDDTTRHDGFLTLCQQHGSFAYAAARYRIAAGDPALAPVAEQRLRQIRLLAEQMLLAVVRAEPLPKVHLIRWIAGAVLVLVLIIGAVVVLSRR